MDPQTDTTWGNLPQAVAANRRRLCVLGRVRRGYVQASLLSLTDHNSHFRRLVIEISDERIRLLPQNGELSLDVTRMCMSVRGFVRRISPRSVAECFAQYFVAGIE